MIASFNFYIYIAILKLWIRNDVTHAYQPLAIAFNKILNFEFSASADEDDDDDDDDSDVSDSDEEDEDEEMEGEGHKDEDGVGLKSLMEEDANKQSQVQFHCSFSSEPTNIGVVLHKKSLPFGVSY